ncbi:hypothetical protein HUU59_11085 [bacterium]|nr:hypothetical protein [bacterium]
MWPERTSPGRIEVDDHSISLAVSSLTQRLYHAVEKHGRGAFLNDHEIIGRVRAELREVERESDLGNLTNVIEELLDIAAVCVFAKAGEIAVQKGGETYIEFLERRHSEMQAESTKSVLSYREQVSKLSNNLAQLQHELALLRCTEKP